MCSKYEQETIINYNEDEKTATVYTYNKSLKKKLDKLAIKYPDIFIVVAEDKTGAKTYRIPKKYITVSTPRSYTDKQKKEMKERGKGLQKRERISKSKTII